MGADQTMVRMGELAVSDRRGHELVALGLGSCIGLALLDRRRGAAGLAHVVLPQSPDGHDASMKFADHAVPALVDRLVALGARRVRLEAVLVGGASMFAGAGSTLEVGQRNAAAVKEALAKERIKIVAADTGGNKGRTARVDPATGTVVVRKAGGKDEQFYPKLLTRVLQEVA
jgi:chemotaxis protein CheD